MTDPILDSARDLLGNNKVHRPLPLPHADNVRSICRALIARTEALVVAREAADYCRGDLVKHITMVRLIEALDALGDAKDAT